MTNLCRLLFFISVLSSSSFAATDSGRMVTFGSSQLTVTLREPQGWKADLQHAKTYESDLIFYKATDRAPTQTGALIRVRMNPKTDENVTADLDHDKQMFRQKYPDALFTQLSAPNDRYTVVSLILAHKNDVYNYVSYLNPGPKTKVFLTLNLKKQKHEADPGELNAFRQIVASVQATPPSPK